MFTQKFTTTKLQSYVGKKEHHKLHICALCKYIDTFQRYVQLIKK